MGKHERRVYLEAIHKRYCRADLKPNLVRIGHRVCG